MFAVLHKQHVASRSLNTNSDVAQPDTTVIQTCSFKVFKQNSDVSSPGCEPRYSKPFTVQCTYDLDDDLVRLCFSLLASDLSNRIEEWDSHQVSP